MLLHILEGIVSSIARRGVQYACEKVNTLLQILEGIVPSLLRKKEEEEKRLRVAQRMQRQMDNIMLDENGGFGR